MRSVLKLSLWFAVVTLVVMNGGPPLGAAQHPHQTTTVAVGDHNDEITLTSTTRIADTTLKPGRYYIDHRVEGTTQPRRVVAHYIHFTEITPEVSQRRQAARRALSGSPVAHPGDIECTVEALKKPASKTTIITSDEGGVRRITRIEIAGENVAHVF